MDKAFKIITVSGSQFRLQVLRRDGTPDVPLTLFANDLFCSLSDSSVPVYMREVVALLNWADTDPVAATNAWNPLGQPHEVRNIVRQYLMVAAECKLTTRPDTFGLKAVYVNRTQGTHIQPRLLLTALKRFFEFLISIGTYCYENPFVHEDAGRISSAMYDTYRSRVMALEGRPPMPLRSGIDTPPPNIRLSENYFRCVDDQWIPQTIDDPDFPSIVYEAGRQYGWGLREHCAVRTLFESGSRISEVFGLTASDWSVSDFKSKFASKSKGSHGRRVKTLVVSTQTAKMYRRYFDDGSEGRRAYDPERLTVRRLGSLHTADTERLSTIPIYLTERGTPMTAKAFRDYYWRPALRASGIDADPHTCRHWFVTNALRNIERAARIESDVLRGKEELIQYMGWRSGERTLLAYEHVQRQKDFGMTLSSVHRKMNSREKNYAKSAKQLPRTNEARRAAGEPDADAAPNPDLLFLLGEDDD